MIKLNEFISLSEGKTISRRFSIDWTKTFERTKIPHMKPVCLDCVNGKNCGYCVKEPQMDCFNCKMESL